MTLNILVIQGGVNKKLPSGEQTVISNELGYLSNNYCVNVEYIENKQNFFYRFINLIWSVENYKKILLLIDKYNPDIIHFHSVIPYLSISVFHAAKKRNVKVVQTLHNVRWLCVEGGFYRAGKFCDRCVGTNGIQGVIKGCGHGRVVSLFVFLVNYFVRYDQRIENLVDKFIAVSDFIKDKHTQSGFSEEKLVVNNNLIGIDLINRSKYMEAWDKRTGVAFAGRISTAKGVAILKFLIPILHDHPLHIIGSGPELKELQQFCEISAYTHVVFWGKQSKEKTLEILGSVICTIVPSQCGEAFSMVAAESMALATPVVASDLGGLADMVRAGGGTVVNAGEYNQFSHAVLTYLERPLYAERVGKIGEDYVCKNLSNEVKGNALISIYKELLH